MPADTSEKISQKIKEIYDCIQEGEMKTQFNIIFHFIKKRDERGKRGTGIFDKGRNKETNFCYL